MGNDHHSNAQFPVDLLDQLQNSVGGIGVQRAGGFVTKQNLGIGSQRAGNGNTLFLAAGKLCRVCLGLVRQAYQFQQFPGTGLCLVFGYLGQFHREHDIAQAGTLHQQIELLKNHGNIPPGRTQFRGTEILHLATVDNNVALIGTFQHIDAAHQRGFTSARHADDAVDIPVPNGQVDIVEGDHRAPLGGKTFGQVL